MMDENVSEYTSFRTFCNKRYIRRFLGSIFDVCAQNAFVLFRLFYEREMNANTKYAKLGKHGRLHSQFYRELGFGLVGYKLESDLPSSACSISRPHSSTRIHSSRVFHPNTKRAGILRTKVRCVQCNKPICTDHQIISCPTCSKNQCAPNTTKHVSANKRTL